MPHAATTRRAGLQGRRRSSRYDQRAARRRRSLKLLGDLREAVLRLGAHPPSRVLTGPGPRKGSPLQHLSPHRDAQLSSALHAAFNSVEEAWSRRSARIAACLFSRERGKPLSTPMPYFSQSASLPVRAARVALPGSPPPVCLSSSPRAWALVPTPLSSPVPHARVLHRIADKEAPCLASRLDAITTFLPADQVKATVGLFTVAKSRSTDRLIFDCREASAFFPTPPAFAMATPAHLARRVVPKGRRLFCGKSDLSNFFYTLKLPSHLQPFFAIPPLPGDVACPEGYVRVCTALPMGWTFSPILAQTLHLDVVASAISSFAARFPTTAVVDLSNDKGLTFPEVGYLLVIDDLIFVGTNYAATQCFAECYRQEVYRWGLSLHPTKWVPVGQQPLVALGVVLDPTRQVMHPEWSKLSSLRSYTRQLLQSGECTGRTLSSLLGKWVWWCLLYRPTLSALNQVYRFIHCAGTHVFQLWPSVRAELTTLLALTPTMYVELSSSRPVVSYCTDASSRGIGVVKGPVTPASMLALGHAEGEMPSSPKAQQAVSAWITTTAWQPQFQVSIPLPDTGIIAAHEMLAVKFAVRHACSNKSNFGATFILGTDNSVVLGILAKGRTSAGSMQSITKQTLAWALAFGIRLAVVFVPTAIQPADDLSRIC